jgi:hypothetical protein
LAKYTWIQWFKPSTSTWYYGIPEKQIEFVEQKSYDGVLWTAEISVREFDSNDVIWYQKLENAGNDYGSTYNWGDATVTVKRFNMDDQLFFEIKKLFQEPSKVIAKHLSAEDIRALSNRFSYDEIQQMLPTDLQSGRIKNLVETVAEADERKQKKINLIDSIIEIKDSSNIVQIIPHLEQLRRTFESARVPKEWQYKQRVVTADDAEKLINEGWQYVGTLPNGKVVVKMYPDIT